MGDRGNIKFSFGVRGNVWLYSHGGGAGLWVILRDVLVRHERWDDPPYLCRMVFDAMVGKSQGGETGFGISPTMGDNEHPILTVDCAHGKITIDDEEDQRLQKWRKMPAKRSYTFEEFCTLTTDPRW